MPEIQPLAVVSYLPTKEDYEAFRLAAVRSKNSDGRKMAVRFGGAAVAGVGAALFLFTGSGIMERVAWAALILLGLFWLSYYDVIQPYTVRKQARARYEASRRMLVSQTVELFDRQFILRTDRYQAKLPYELLYKVVEDKNIYLLYTGEDEVRFIPKRVMTEEQCRAFTEILKERIGEAYSG